MQNKTVAFHTLGCKVNQYDTQAMRERFLQEGYTEVPFEGTADVYVVNTCTVTGTGDRKSLSAIRRCARRNPEAQIVVCGCLAQRSAEEVRLPGVRLILGTQRRGEVVRLLEEAMKEGCQLVAVDSLKKAAFEQLQVDFHEGHTRAVMKIQEGCDRYCTYCIIPSVRGPIRSRSPEEIRSEAQRLGNAGYRELVLTGIHLTSYGRDLGDGSTLLDGIRAACDAGAVQRVRLGSLEPVVVTEDFIEGLCRLPKVCRQFHLALQSGSDSVLLRMGRRYRKAEFLEACARLRSAFPGCSITTDIMTGFPGETMEEFAESMETCKKAGFARMHVFPYSEREGTRAEGFPGAVPVAERERRARQMIALGQELACRERARRVGTGETVLLEEPEGEAFLGYTGSYMKTRVVAEAGTDLHGGELWQVDITGVQGELLLARAVSRVVY